MVVNLLLLARPLRITHLATVTLTDSFNHRTLSLTSRCVEVCHSSFRSNHAKELMDPTTPAFFITVSVLFRSLQTLVSATQTQYNPRAGLPTNRNACSR